MSGMRIGYVPYSSDLVKPGDRRRFPHYARSRGLAFELADPSESYDLVVLSARSDLVRWARCPPSTRLVYDLIDSYLAIPDNDLKARFRGLSKFSIGELSRPVRSYRRAIEEMARRADAVVCSTVEQKAMLQRFCPNVHVILDFHSELGSSHKQSYEQVEPFRLVWEGLPQNLSGFKDIARVLRSVATDHPLTIHLVTDRCYFAYLDRFWRQSTKKLAEEILGSVVIHEWSPRKLVEVATVSDLAVIPLDLNDPLASGKPENKVLIFWRMGVPVVASATPAHRRVMRAVGLDTACADSEEWEFWLRRLIEDEAERQRGGELGRVYANAIFDEASLLERWDAVMESLW